MKATWMVVFGLGGLGALGGLAACGGGSKAAGGGGGTTPKGGEHADVSAVKSDLVVYTDGKGHYFPLVEPDPEKEPPRDQTLFYGDGKTFYAAQVAQFNADGLKFEIGFNDPRIPATPAGSIKRELGKVTLSCYGTDLELTKLPAAEAQTMLAGATYIKNTARYSPLALARRGEEYIYVDSERGEEAKYRVFTGKKGDMHPVKVIHGKYDEGANEFRFDTEKGTLVASRDADAREYAFGLAWDGKKDTYETLGRSAEWHLIFDDLGVYRSRAPTPCDPVMP